MSEKISMRKIKEILRLHWELSLSNRDIANSIKISSNTVGNCLRRARAARLSWPLPPELDDAQLEQMLYRPVRNKTPQGSHDIDWLQMHKELKRKGMTRYLLWDEYKQYHPNGLSYSQFCRYYNRWQAKIDTCMRQSHKAGEKMFIDYAGMTLPITDRFSGEVKEAQIFVACLGASNYTFAEATLSQSLPDWIGSHVRAFKFFGGLPEILVPDNLRSGVKASHLYEPDINPTYQDMAEHYGVAVIPARVRKPQDKAKVEEAVQHIERQILARLRNRTFFSLYELNQAIKELLDAVNTKPFQKLLGSRKSQFEELEKETLKPLPQTPYVFAEWKYAKLSADYHLSLDGHYYSAPYKLIQNTLDVRYTQNTVEIFYKGKRVASHKRSYKKGGFTTDIKHMPEAHQQQAQWTPQRIINWAKKNGEFTGKLAEQIILSRRCPQQGYRSCFGIIRLEKSYSSKRLENACRRALHFQAYSYKSVLSILKNNLDSLPLSAREQQDGITKQQHEHVRGKGYFY